LPAPPVSAGLLTLESIPGTHHGNGSVRDLHRRRFFLIAMNIMLLIVGMFMDIISATMILGPVFLPMLDAFNINWMHFGLIMTVNLAIGYCTPPMGVSLYTSPVHYRQPESDLRVSKAVMPFIAIQILVLLLITFFPDVVWLMGFE
jgi:TRAP-type C4-dicarboxylate transport system permease large subunit